MPIDYLRWRNELFGQSLGSDASMVELSDDAHALGPDETLEFIGLALSDPGIHQEFNKDPITVGLRLLFNNELSDFVIAYLEAGDEAIRSAAVTRLSLLYTNFFERYCTGPLERVGDSDDSLEGFCYMFWDVFVVYPGNSSRTVVDAALDLMADVLRSRNEHCQVSALHGLGHWVLDEPRAKRIIDDFVSANRHIASSVVVTYALQAATGNIQ